MQLNQMSILLLKVRQAESSPIDAESKNQKHHQKKILVTTNFQHQYVTVENRLCVILSRARLE